MRKKCQVFISSTYLDMKKERQEAVKIILRQGHIPAGMELFGQEDDTQWEVIRQWIDNSDIVLLMLKNRYGTVCKNTGISYTQMEYEYAVEIKKPIIRIVLDQDEKYENDNLLQQFKSMVMNDTVVTPIHSEAEMAERIVQMLGKYSMQANNGWVRYSDALAGSKRYNLIQYLMFGEDKGSEGFNRFMVAPKIMMLMDMKRDYNPVHISHLVMRYSIIQNADYGEDVYDCVRKWELNNIQNISNRDISSYHIYTATDIGERHSGKVRLRHCINERDFELDNRSRNNGISCFEWEIRPSVPGRGNLADMEISERVDKAWDFHRKLDGERNIEIIYFIPQNYGEKIDRVTFLVEVDAPQVTFDMKLFKIVERGSEFRRERCGGLGIIGQNGRRTYGLELKLDDRDMEGLYYIVITKCS